MHLTANISGPQKNFIAIDLHSDNAVICVRRNALNKAGELVGKNIWCGRVSIRDGLDNFIISAFAVLPGFRSRCRGRIHLQLVLPGRCL